MKFFTGILLFFLSSSPGHGFLLPSRNEGGSRIVGGISVPISAAPYQVSLLFNGFHMCGGNTIKSSKKVKCL